MNLNHLVNMVVNQVVRRVVNIVVDRGFRMVSRTAADVIKPGQDQPAAPSSDPARDASLQAMADQAARTAKLSRRLRR